MALCLLHQPPCHGLLRGVRTGFSADPCAPLFRDKHEFNAISSIKCYLGRLLLRQPRALEVGDVIDTRVLCEPPLTAPAMRNGPSQNRLVRHNAIIGASNVLARQPASQAACRSGRANRLVCVHGQYSDLLCARQHLRSYDMPASCSSSRPAFWAAIVSSSAQRRPS